MFDRARAVNSDNQLYRQAGNSVTIQVVYAVGRQILAAQEALEQGSKNDVSKRMEPVAPDDWDGGRPDRHPSLFRAVCLTAGGGLNWNKRS